MNKRPIYPMHWCLISKAHQDFPLQRYFLFISAYHRPVLTDIVETKVSDPEHVAQDFGYCDPVARALYFISHVNRLAYSWPALFELVCF